MILFIISMFFTFIILQSEVQDDLDNWGNINHGANLRYRLFSTGVLSIIAFHPAPLLTFFTFFNPTIAASRGLGFFYLGDTAKYDIIMKKIFGKAAGVISLLGWVTLLVLSFIYIPIG